MSYFNQVQDDEDLAWEAAMDATDARHAVEKRYEGSTGDRYHEGVDLRTAAVSREMRLWDDACVHTEARLKKQGTNTLC